MDTRDRRTEFKSKYPALARRMAASSSPSVHDFGRVFLGHDERGRPLYLDDSARLEHVWCIGSTGSGKSTLAIQLIMQDIRRGRGGLLIDPHGDLYRALLAQLYADGFLESGRVHLLDPNVRSHILPFNALAAIPGTDDSVLADALLEAFERAWGDEDTHEKPAIRSNLKSGFIALAELKLPLTDCKLLFDPNDTHGVRERAIQTLTNEYAREELERLHRIALADRSKREFNLEVRGPINRLNEFVSCDVVRAMLGVVDEPGKPRRTFDLLSAMDRGDIVLFNGEHGGAVSEADTNLLAAILLRYVFLLSARRRNCEPWFMHIDECHKVLTGDVSSLLAECRKYGIACHLYHQFEAQLGKRDELIFQACLNSTEVKIVFRVKSAEEAQHLAENVIPLSLEMPVKASIRKTQIGVTRVRLANHSDATHEAETDAEGESEGETESITIGRASVTTTGTSVADGTSDSASDLLSAPLTLFGPNAEGATFPQVVTAQGSSTGASHVEGTTNVNSEMESEARASGRISTRSRSRARTRGLSVADGWSEANEPIFADLPASFHSKENELYFKGEMIRRLPTDKCFVAFRGTSACVTVPPPKRKKP